MRELGSEKRFPLVPEASRKAPAEREDTTGRRFSVGPRLHAEHTRGLASLGPGRAAGGSQVWPRRQAGRSEILSVVTSEEGAHPWTLRARRRRCCRQGGCGAWCRRWPSLGEMAGWLGLRGDFFRCDECFSRRGGPGRRPHAMLTRGHRPARRVHVDGDVLLRVRRVEVEKLRDDEVRHVVVDGAPEADDTLRKSTPNSERRW